MAREESRQAMVEVEAAGAVKLIFGTASLIDVALKFAASPEHDHALESKQALPELAGFLEKGFGFPSPATSSSGQLRRELRRLLLMGEILCGETRPEIIEKYSSLRLPVEAHHADRIREACSSWRRRTDLLPAYMESALSVEKEMHIAERDWTLESLSILETFPAFEQKLIRHAEETLLEENPDEALQLARNRKNGFWSLQEPRFFSITATYHRIHGVGSSDEIRVKVSDRADRKEVGIVAMAAYGFEEGTREILLRDGQANAITVMLTDDQGLDHATGHVLDAISQVELAKSEPIPVNIAF